MHYTYIISTMGENYPKGVTPAPVLGCHTSRRGAFHHLSGVLAYHVECGARIRWDVPVSYRHTGDEIRRARVEHKDGSSTTFAVVKYSAT